MIIDKVSGLNLSHIVDDYLHSAVSYANINIWD